MSRKRAAALAALSAVSVALAPALPALAQSGGGGAAVLPAGTRMYLSLDELVSSARGGDDVGTVVRCRVWRDVEDRGVVFLKAGSPATCRVDKVSRRNIGGFEGHVSIAGVDAKSVDGQTVMLSGGYHKEGDGHKALVLGVGILLLWPVLFVPGGNAELPPGTVFDVSTVNDLRVATAGADAAPRRVDLRSLTAAQFSAEFMLDDFMAQPKHDTFRIRIAKDGKLPDKLVIDTVNGRPVDPLPLAIKSPAEKDGTTTAIGEISPKTLAKHFAKGINRFEVAYTEGGERHATEVVMDVQM